MGVLNKKTHWYKVPDTKPYEFSIEKPILAILCIAVVIGIILALSSCNAYKGIEKKPPLTVKDSARLSARFKSTYPQKPAKVSPGKTVTKTVTKVDSSKIKALQARIEQLIDENIFKDELLNTVPNTDSLKKAITREVLKNCKTETDTIYSQRVDTILQDTPETLAAINTAIYLKNEAEKALSKSETLLELKTKQAKDRLWILIALAFYFVGSWAIKLYKKFSNPIKLT